MNPKVISINHLLPDKKISEIYSHYNAILKSVVEELISFKTTHNSNYFDVKYGMSNQTNQKITAKEVDTYINNLLSSKKTTIQTLEKLLSNLSPLIFPKENTKNRAALSIHRHFFYLLLTKFCIQQATNKSITFEEANSLSKKITSFFSSREKNTQDIFDTSKEARFPPCVGAPICNFMQTAIALFPESKGIFKKDLAKIKKLFFLAN